MGSIPHSSNGMNCLLIASAPWVSHLAGQSQIFGCNTMVMPMSMLMYILYIDDMALAARDPMPLLTYCSIGNSSS